jgi:HK97 family phage prohead protease
MELPAEMFVKPIDGADDLFAYRYDFTLEGKSAEQPVVTELEDGDLIIEGYAAVWDGDDRSGENFAPGAFAKGLENFLSGQAALCYHHKHDMCLGKVLDLKEEGKGLYMKARVDGAIQDDPRLKGIYQQIKRGTYNGLSTFGRFKRGIGALANKIIDTDLMEISVTPVPAHPGTSFAALAGKALATDLKVPDGVAAPDLPEDEIREDDFYQVQYALESIARVLERLEKRGEGSKTTTGDTLL